MDLPSIHMTHFSVTSKSFEKEPLPSARASKAAESMKTCECRFYVKLGYCSHILALEKFWENDDFAQKNCIACKARMPHFNLFFDKNCNYDIFYRINQKLSNSRLGLWGSTILTFRWTTSGFVNFSAREQNKVLKLILECRMVQDLKLHQLNLLEIKRGFIII
ncbi:hypothetical protein BpHYR1_032806, partial [Brachionus plicatilis]